MSDSNPLVDRRTVLRTSGASIATAIASGTAIVGTASASDSHPKDDAIEYSWWNGHRSEVSWRQRFKYRHLEPGPLVLIDVSKVGGRTETWRNATTYAEYILDTASQWSVFNDVDGIRGNIRWHAPRTSSRAGIQLWEQGNPLYDRSNLDGDEELERSDDYDSYAELKQEWCRETPYEC